METAINARGILRKAQEQKRQSSHVSSSEHFHSTSRKRYVNWRPMIHSTEREDQGKISGVSEMITWNSLWNGRKTKHRREDSVCEIIMHYKNTVFVW